VPTLKKTKQLYHVYAYTIIGANTDFKLGGHKLWHREGKKFRVPPNSEGTASQWETLKLKITEVTNNTMRLVAANRSHVSICPGQAV